jgi:hypothetical protein
VIYAQCILFLVYPNHCALVLTVQVCVLLTTQQFPTDHITDEKTKSKLGSVEIVKAIT